MVAMISQNQFDEILKTNFNGKILKNGTNIDISEMTNSQLVDLANDIVNNKALYNRKAFDDFSYTVLKQIINAKPDKKIIKRLKELKNLLISKYPNLNIENIAIQPVGGVFDLKPYMTL